MPMEFSFSLTDFDTLSILYSLKIDNECTSRMKIFQI